MKTEVDIGLSEHDLRLIRAEIAAIPEIESVVLFGSRAKGTHKKGSDVDFALDGDSLTRKEMLQLSYRLNQETVLPYRFDLLILSDADTPVRDHILRDGVPIYP